MIGNHKKGITDGRLLLFLTLVLAANSAYIAAYGDPSLFYVVNALLHPVLGIFAAILFAVYLRRHPELWRASAGKLAVVLLAVSAGFGGFLMYGGMTRPHSWELYVHVGCAIAGLFFALLWLRGRALESYASEKTAAKTIRRAWRCAAVALPSCLIFYTAVALFHHYFPNPDYLIHNPLTAPTTPYHEGGGRNSLLFPSSAQSANGKTIPAEFFLNAKSCEPCHKDIYRQWHSSMHHYSSFNNQWYRKSIEYMQDTVGIKPSMLCAGCHDQAVAFTDMMQTHPIRQIEFTPEAQAGLTCVSCHAIARVTSTMGNGSYVLKYPALDRLVASKYAVIRKLADYAIILDPKPHRAVFFRPFMHRRREVAEVCSVCHKVQLDVPDNHYRFIRGFDDYDHWQASGVSGNSARSFYYPPKPLTCVDCHMPLVPSHDYGNINGYVNSHRFVAANTAVPTSYGDEKQIEDVEKFLKGAVTVDLFAIAEEPKGAAETYVMPGLLGVSPQLSTLAAVGEESSRGLEAQEVSTAPPLKLMAPLNRGAAYLRRGETARVEVVVRTRRVGHFFPGGTIDAFDCWLELKAVDNRGHIIFWSGEVADHGRGPVDPGAEFYRSVGVDAGDHLINKRNAWTEHAVVYVNVIPPGAADTVHFRLKIPKNCGNRITLTAKLNYRKFDWWFTEWAFRGVRDPYQKNRHTSPYSDNTRWIFDGNLSKVSAKYKRLPNVPIVVMSKDTVTIPVLAASRQPFQQRIQLRRKDLFRWNDYGIGLLLQGDLKGAARAFKIVTRIDPKYANGWVNVARALVQEGNVSAAVAYLKTAIGLDPRLASAYYYMGQVYQTQGNYPRAYDEYAKAAAIHPEDRVVSNAMGRILFFERKYAAAVRQFQHTLSIAPQNLGAHYNLMLCYRGLEDRALSDRERKLFLRFKADEAAESLIGPYEMNHPNADNMAQPVHEHVSINDENPKPLEFFWNYGQRWGWLPGKLGRMQQETLARYAKDGSYGYLAAMRRAKLKLQPDHKVMTAASRRKSPFPYPAALAAPGGSPTPKTKTAGMASVTAPALRGRLSSEKIKAPR
jgi:tetratricopeptide (TPR) repeat protein